MRLPSHRTPYGWVLGLALVSVSGWRCGPVEPGGNDNPCGLTGPVCVSESEAYVCNGPEIVTQLCGSAMVCVEPDGCVERVCTPGEASCVDANTERRCVFPGHTTEDVACNPGVVCSPGSGCVPPVCAEGQRTCLGADVVGLCNATGTDFEPAETCSDTDPNSICHNGICVSACEVAELTQSYFGCVYYAADLPNNTNSVATKDYAIVVSNPSQTDTATVTISTEVGVVTTLIVPPRGVETYSVFPRPRSIVGTGQWRAAYKIVSNTPIAVYQFNSLTTISAASTDASLLFAAHTLAKKYYVMDYTGFDGGTANGDNFLAVYAADGVTSVTVTPTQPILASEAGSPVPFAASPAGVPVTFTLDEFDVLVLMPSTTAQDLTGTVVEGDAPIGVFGGNRCTNVPVGMLYCDHLEQQIFPRQAIGDFYVVSKTHARTSCAVEDRIRVLADADNTVVTVDPPVAGPYTLNAGEWAEFGIMDHTVVSSDQPFYVGQFIRSSNSGECDSEADPAFILQVPVAQFRLDYVFLTPETYTTDYVAIIAEPGANVLLDGQSVTLTPTPVGTSGYSVTDVVVAVDGGHVVEANSKVGVIVYGYGGPSGADPNGVVNVSYGYPAGLDLVAINPVE